MAVKKAPATKFASKQQMQQTAPQPPQMKKGGSVKKK